MPTRQSINFIGNGAVSLADNGPNNSTDVTILGGGSSDAGASPIGPAGGDLYGSYPDASVGGLRNSPLPTLDSGLLEFFDGGWRFGPFPSPLPDAGTGGIWYQNDAGIVTPLASGGAGTFLAPGPAWSFPPAPGVLYTLTGNPATDVNATTAETNLFTYTLPGNTLPTNGVIRAAVLTSAFNNSGGNVTQTYRFYFGGSAYLQWTATNGTSNSHDVVQTFDISLVATGATNAQYIEGTSLANVGATSAGSALIETTANSTLGQNNTSVAVDSTVNEVIKLTAQSTSANANVHAKLYSVKLVLQ